AVRRGRLRRGLPVATDPIHQFQIYNILSIPVGGVDFGFTNSALFMAASVAIITVFMLWATSGRTLVPSRIQSVAELLYEFVASMLRSSAGSEGMRFFPFVFSIFMFVLV